MYTVCIPLNLPNEVMLGNSIPSLVLPAKKNVQFKLTRAKTYKTKPTPNPHPNPYSIPNPKTHPIPNPNPTPNPKTLPA